MYETINSAFSHCHPPYIPAEFERLRTPEQILSELGVDPLIFVVTISKQPAPNTEPKRDGPKVIACGSASMMPDARSSSKLAADERTTVERSEAASRPIPGVVDWELKHLCVRPEYMKQGLAGKLLEMLEEEMISRTRASEDSGGAPPQQMRIMITTLKELNGHWYERRGFEMVEKLGYPAGTLGGMAPFAIWHMDRHVHLRS